MSKGDRGSLGAAIRRRLLRISALALALFGGAPAGAQTLGPDRFDGLLQAFAEAALQTETGRPVPLRRWTTALAVRIAGDAAPPRLATAQREVERLADIARLPVGFLPAEAAGENLLILIEPRAAYIVNGRAARCYTLAQADRRGALRRAEIRINASDRRGGDCLAHELMHALGLPGHPHRITTVLADSQSHAQPTEADEALLRLLYAPQLSPGLAPAEALARARAPLAALLGMDAAPAVAALQGIAVATRTPTPSAPVVSLFAGP